MMVCTNVWEKRMVATTSVSRHAVLSDPQRLIYSSEGPSKAWFQEQEENARRQTSSAAPINEDDDDFKPIPVVNILPGTLLSFF